MTLQDHKAAAVGAAHNATLNKLTDTLVAIWDLETPQDEHAPKAEALLYTNPGDESVLGTDERQLVPQHQFAHGGKFRSIVKLFCQFKDKTGQETWMHGTGWLIKDDLLVTAGHCAFDWGHKLGPCTQVKAYIGYNGKASTKSPDCQFRHVARVATTSGWLAAKGNRHNDVSFMKLDQSFVGVKPFSFIDTPISGSISLGVVGYPADLKGVNDEAGAAMYEMFLPTRWNLSESEWTMLEYQIDTFGGNSGSPVLRESDNVAMGVHVYGGVTNSASVIGIYGNQFLDYVAAFDLKPEKVALPGANSSATPGIHYVQIPTSKTPDVLKEVVNLSEGQFQDFSSRKGFQGIAHAHSNGTRNNLLHPHLYGAQDDHQDHHHFHGDSDEHESVEAFYTMPQKWNNSSWHNAVGPVKYGAEGARIRGPEGAEMDEEGFMDFVRKAVSVGAPIVGGALKMGLPIAFGPLGGVVGAVASTALSAAGHLAKGGAEGGFVDIPSHNDLAVRSIYAEAALQSMLKMDKKRLEEEGFLDDMKTVVSKLAPVVKRVAPKVLSVVKDDVMQIMLEHLNKGKTSTEGAFELRNKKSERLLGGGGRDLHSQVAFGANTGAESFLQHVQASAEPGEEGFFDIIKSGVKVLAPHVGPALTGLGRIVSSMSAESGIVDEQQTPDRGLEGLHERAVLAEAALQAAINAPHKMLQEEGFFDNFGSIVKSIGSTVISHAPGVIKAVTPIVGTLIKGALGAESSTVQLQPGGRGLRSKRSTPSLRSQSILSNRPGTSNGYPRDSFGQIVEV